MDIAGTSSHTNLLAVHGGTARWEQGQLSP